MVKNKKIGVISLGCDKNRVDTEKMLAVLSTRHKLVSSIEEAEIIIVNTCAFLESARKEAITEVLTASSLKTSGKAQKIIVTGCLPQNYVGELFGALNEADAFLGVSDYSKINEVIDKIYQGERINAVGTPCNEQLIDRVKTTDGYAYLKIADGCSNHCTYCLIPKIRGKYRSIPTEELLREVESLGDTKELILVAQDVTKYGYDLTPQTSLVQLIRRLSALKNVGGIRLLYCYPENITDELINEFKVNAKMIRYIDVPLQHADDNVLKLMNRKGTGEQYLSLIEKLKSEVNGIAIRSTFIAGFPGETEEAFLNLVEFLKKAKLFNAGFFKYSREKETPSDKLPNHVAGAIKTKRVKKLYSVQRKVVKEINKGLVGKSFKVCAEGFDKDTLTYFGRAYFNAPDIDGKIYFFSEDEIEYGKFYSVKITDFNDYDLYGERV